MSPSRTSQPEPHDSHDPLTIAAFAAGDLVGQDRDQGEVLLAECAACRNLHDDLQAISTAVRAMPPVQRPSQRVFQVSIADAQRLARGARWRALARLFGASRGSVIRPISAALMTLGLATFMISAQPLLHLGSGAAAPSQDRQLMATAPALATAPVSSPAPAPLAASAPALPASSTPEGFGAIDSAGASTSAAPADGSAGRAAMPQGSIAPQGNVEKEAADEAATSLSAAPPILLPVLGGVLFIAGSVLLVLHRLALRAR